MLNSFPITKREGAIFTVFISVFLILVIYNKHIREANSVSFAAGGDGLKSTFGSLYHIKYDSSYWHFGGMNYPFGESVFYTGNQTFLTNILKLAGETGWNAAGYALGILNIWLLMSFVFCALFLYLIMTELGLPPWYTLLGSLAITFLSPQWERLGGHYNLAYAYVFPLVIWLLIRFYRKPSWTMSVVFGLFIFAIAGKHVYYIPMAGIIWLVYWILLLSRAKRLYRNTVMLLPHMLIQFLLPVIAFALLTAAVDPNADRTAYPWGFFKNVAYFREIFLPIYRPYGRWIPLGNFTDMRYVGAVSSLVFFSLPVIMIKQWISTGRSSVFRISDSFILNAFLLGGLVALVISLGFPFTLGAEHWLNYTGPLRQFRSAGRFVFPFFYIINIFSLYVIWKWKEKKSRVWVNMILVLALLWNGYDAFLNMYRAPGKQYTRFEALIDRENILSENRWVKNRDWSAFQCLMPMPYYHIGSENYWVNGNSPVIEDSFIASLKTGLPLNGVMLSRTSIGETLANLDLFWEPAGSYEVLRQYDPVKPILVARHRNGELNANELRILEKSSLIDSNNQLFFYSLYPDSLTRIQQEYSDRLHSTFNSGLSCSQAVWHYFESYDSNPGRRFRGDIARAEEFAGCRIPEPGKYEASFWYKGAGRDLWPRTGLIISLYDSSMIRYSGLVTDFFRETVLRAGDWALVSFPFEARSPGDSLTLKYENSLVIDGEMIIDRVLVRNEQAGISLDTYSLELFNNRIVRGRINSLF